MESSFLKNDAALRGTAFPKVVSRANYGIPFAESPGASPGKPAHVQSFGVYYAGSCAYRLLGLLLGWLYATLFPPRRLILCCDGKLHSAAGFVQLGRADQPKSPKRCASSSRISDCRSAGRSEPARTARRRLHNFLLSLRQGFVFLAQRYPDGVHLSVNMVSHQEHEVKA